MFSGMFDLRIIEVMQRGKIKTYKGLPHEKMVSIESAINQLGLIVHYVNKKKPRFTAAIIMIMYVFLYQRFKHRPKFTAQRIIFSS